MSYPGQRNVRPAKWSSSHATQKPYYQGLSATHMSYYLGQRNVRQLMSYYQGQFATHTTEETDAQDMSYYPGLRDERPVKWAFLPPATQKSYYQGHPTLGPAIGLPTNSYMKMYNGNILKKELNVAY